MAPTSDHPVTPREEETTAEQVERFLRDHPRFLAERPALADAIVVIGSEGRGLSPEVAATLTRRVTIPRHGQAESLNAAVAAGIVCAALRAKT
jgi:tRNA G18 (ribose-2'-O)-methylase SpoU